MGRTSPNRSQADTITLERRQRLDGWPILLLLLLVQCCGFAHLYSRFVEEANRDKPGEVGADQSLVDTCDNARFAAFAVGVEECLSVPVIELGRFGRSGQIVED